jgi:hypothetical protein
LSSELKVSGLIGRVDDRDVFTFSVGESGSVQLAVSGKNSFDPQVHLSGIDAKLEDGVYTFDVTAGQNYTLFLAGDQTLGFYDMTLTLDASVRDLGSIEYAMLRGEQLSGSENWYTLAASRAGLLTVEALVADRTGDVNLQLFDAGQQLVSIDDSMDGGLRLDVDANAGEKFYLRVTGTSADVTYRLTNLVAVDDGQVFVHGTSADDAFVVDATESLLTVNNVSYPDILSAATRLAISGGAGQDELVYHTGSSGERLTLQVGQLEAIGEQLNADASGVEHVEVYSRSGSDYAFLYDSTGDDTLVATVGRVAVVGDGFRQEVHGFERVYAYATRGGHDIAELYDSSGNDTLWATDYGASISGRGFYHYVQQFDRVYAYATQGGTDVARLYDSPGNDTFFADTVSASLSGAGYYQFARYFDRVYAYATRGGTDVARLFDSAGNDTLVSNPTSTSLTGSGFLNYAQHFDRVYAYASRGGFDVARFYDSAGNDTFFADHFSTSMRGVGYYNYSQQFDQVYSYATRGGHDVATLYDSPGNDVFLADSYGASLRGNGFANYVQRFDRVYGDAGRGGRDIARLYDSGGNDTLQANAVATSFSGYGFFNSARRFDHVYAYATHGGTDTAVVDKAVREDVSLVGGFTSSANANSLARLAPASGNTVSSDRFTVTRHAVRELLEPQVQDTGSGLARVVSPTLRTWTCGLDALLARIASNGPQHDEESEVDEYFEQLGETL